MENRAWFITAMVVLVIALGILYVFQTYVGKANGNHCTNCGKNSCDLDCSARKGDLLSGTDLKSLVPSCDLSASEMSERRSFLQSTIVKSITRIEEMENGYDLIFEGQPKQFSAELLDFINFERGCCSSFSFALIFEPHEKAVHLQMYGSKQIKEELAKGFIEAGFLKR